MTPQGRQNLLAVVIYGSFAAVLIGATILATGCSAIRVPKLLNPIAWFHSDPLKKVQETEEKLFLSKVNLVLMSQGLLAAARLELYNEQRPSEWNLRAREYLKLSSENLEQAMGPLPPTAKRAAEEMVKLRASEDPGERAKGDKQLAKVTERSAEEVAAVFKARDELAKLRAQEAATLKRALAAEAQLDAYHLYFWVGFGLWLFLAHVLPRLAEMFPGTAWIMQITKLFAHTGRKTS